MGSLIVSECRKILEVEADATPEELDRAYRRMALIWHPDRFVSHAELHREAETRFKAIGEAYARLKEVQRLGPPAEDPKVRKSEGPLKPPVDSAAPFGLPRSRSWAGPLIVFGAASLLLGMVSWFGRGYPGTSVKGEPVQGVEKPTAPVDPRAPIQGPKSTSILVDEAALVIFSPSQEEQNGLDGRKSARVEAFLANAANFRQRLREVRPDIRVMLTDADEVILGDTVFRRSQTCGFGYILYAPPQQPTTLEGLQMVDELIKYSDAYFTLSR